MTELEDAIGELIQAAPALDPAVLERAARLALAAAAGSVPELARLALAIERVLDDLAIGDVAPGAGLPALAMAAATLAGAADPLAIAGALYELETLMPVPSTGRRPTIDEPRPDVPLEKLSSRPVPPIRRPDAAAAARAARLEGVRPPGLVEMRARYERSDE